MPARLRKRYSGALHFDHQIPRNHKEIRVKAPFAFVCASVLLATACAKAPQERAESAMYDYRCRSGETIRAAYASRDAATVRYRGQAYKMRIAISASGARYVGGGLEWWTKGSGAGSEGTLFRRQADGTTGASIEICIAS